MLGQGTVGVEGIGSLARVTEAGGISWPTTNMARVGCGVNIWLGYSKHYKLFLKCVNKQLTRQIILSLKHIFEEDSITIFYKFPLIAPELLVGYWMETPLN